MQRVQGKALKSESHLQPYYCRWLLGVSVELGHTKKQAVCCPMNEA